ncbi:MAG TPA: hypothetical protein VGR05_07315, partial [Sphingomicrobium sp.]|nr:hypothetical protein [Sphingomicrobium sp.]
ALAGTPATRTSAPQIRATPPRKRRGQRDRPISFDKRWGTTQSRNQPPIAAIRIAARHRDEG